MNLEYFITCVGRYEKIEIAGNLFTEDQGLNRDETTYLSTSNILEPFNFYVNLHPFRAKK